MERSKHLLISLLILPITVFAGSGYKSAIYKAYISNNMVVWKTTIDRMDRETVKSNEFIMELVNYQYGYIGWCIGNDREKEAEIYLEKAEKNLDFLEKASYKLSSVKAYRSAFYGFQIGLNVLKAPSAGPKSVDCAESAIRLDKNNPHGYLQYGHTKYYMPESFGGSKELAIAYYHRAEKLMEQNGEIYENWNYISLLSLIGRAYEAIGDNKSARLYYEKALKMEPEFQWVKNELYPHILKK